MRSVVLEWDEPILLGAQPLAHLEDAMALPEALASLATTAGRQLVGAASTDRWPAARDGFARLFGHADPRQVGMIEGRLESTREDLQTVTGPQLPHLRADLETAWRARLGTLLEAHPELASDLEILLGQLRRAGVTDAVP
jgi:hypothetical protein